MITDQPTQPPAQPRTARTAAASLAAFLDEYPQFDAAPIHFDVHPDGALWAAVSYLSPESGRLVSEMAQALHATVREFQATSSTDEVRGFSCEAVFDGTRWFVRGYLPADAFAHFTLTHNPDPQEWTEAERAEYQALAGTAAAA